VTNTTQTVVATAVPVPVVAVENPGNRVIINTGNLNVRNGPGGSYTILAKVAGGTELEVVGRAGDGVWFLIKGYFGLGWVNAQYVIFRGDARTVPIIEDAYKGGGIIINTTSTVTGTTQTVVATPQPVVQPVAVQGNRVIINTGNLNVRSGPGAGFSVVAVVPGGTELPVVGRAGDGVWYLVQGGFGQGWLNIEFAIFRGDGSTVPIIDVRG
jgi:N-acetylmuramoyl-L-alanine amidase